MSKTITSSPITFIDNTDARRIEVYIASNLPTSQIYNPNTKTYSPDWTITPLIIKPSVFLDATEITSSATFQWQRKYGANAPENISTNKILTVSANELSNSSGIVTYTCIAEYQNMRPQSQIVFTRSDTGTNGLDGQNGTGVNILGVAYANTTISVGNYYDLYSDEACTTKINLSSLQNGDSYLVDGYLCVYNIDRQKFLCTGKIQGPEGKQGESAKQINLSASTQIFKVNKKGEISPSSITVTGNVFNTTISSWKYSDDGGNTYLSSIDGISRNGNVITIIGADMTSSSVTIKASDGIYSDILTIYKVSDGADGEHGAPGATAPNVFLTNEHISFVANSEGQVSGQTVTVNVVAYNGLEKVTPTIGDISDLPTGMSITTDNIIEASNELIIPIVIEDSSDFGSQYSNNGTINIPIIYPVSTNLKLNWSKIKEGISGSNGIDAVSFQIYSTNGYIISNSMPSITLQTLAYNGDIQIETGATYKWYKIINGQPVAIRAYTLATEYNSSETYYIDDIGTVAKPQPASASEFQNNAYYIYAGNATNSYLKIFHTDVEFSCGYMCEMNYNGNNYISVVTIDDKNDINKVFTSKPSLYIAGDIWIVGEDYVPNGVEVGTVLKSEHTNDVYNEEDWITATKYDEKLRMLKDNIDAYNKYFSFNQKDELIISAKDENGVQSKFSTSFSNAQLSFNYDDEAIAYIGSSKMHIKEAEIESSLTVTGQYSGSTMLQTPTINLGNFSLIVESNGSLSIVSNL